MLLLKLLRKKSKVNWFLISGWLILSLGLIILIKTFFPVISQEVKYSAAQLRLTAAQAEITPLDKNFGIVIPKINANARIIPNIDPYNSQIYQSALTKGVAHAKGTVFPGRNGNSFIFSHSSTNFYEAIRYNSAFYLLNKLEIGDEIYTYVNDQKFIYKVIGKELVNPDNVSFLNAKAETKTLTLMTCWPAGTTLKRLIVTATAVW